MHSFVEQGSLSVQWRASISGGDVEEIVESGSEPARDLG